MTFHECGEFRGVGMADQQILSSVAWYWTISNFGRPFVDAHRVLDSRAKPQAWRQYFSCELNTPDIWHEAIP